MSGEQNSDEEKTEAPTLKRREDARKKGQVAKSRDLPSAIALLSAGLFFWLGGGAMIDGAQDILRNGFTNVVIDEITVERFYDLFLNASESGLKLLAPLMLVMVVVAILSHVVQTGPILSFSPLAPKASKISPAKGIKRLLSMTTVVEGVKSIAKVLFIGITVHLILKSEIDQLPGLAATDIRSLFPYLGAVALKIILITGALMFVLGALDLAFQRFQHEKQLRMTKEEVKREMKESEGDPMVRARIRAVQRDAAKKRMMADVPTADVVVTNPTHLAIAIRYDPDGMAAPKVVAKGAGHVAARIREIAKGAGVPVLEDKPLARALFKGVEVGQEVPMNLYQAVAEILAFVYRLNDNKRAFSS